MKQVWEPEKSPQSRVDMFVSLILSRVEQALENVCLLIHSAFYRGLYRAYKKEY